MKEKHRTWQGLILSTGCSPGLAHGNWDHTYHWLLAVIYKQGLRIVLKLHPQMHAGALVFFHALPLSFPCILLTVPLCCEYSSIHDPSCLFFPIFCHLALHQQKLTAGVTSIKQQVDLKSRNSFEDGFVVFLWIYHNYNEGLGCFSICHQGNLIVTHPQWLWSWVISFHSLSIVLACSLCMEGEIENDLPLKS